MQRVDVAEAQTHTRRGGRPDTAKYRTHGASPNAAPSLLHHGENGAIASLYQFAAGPASPRVASLVTRCEVSVRLTERYLTGLTGSPPVVFRHTRDLLALGLASREALQTAHGVRSDQSGYGLRWNIPQLRSQVTKLHAMVCERAWSDRPISRGDRGSLPRSGHSIVTPQAPTQPAEAC